ncbi:MAG: TIGR01459 family HAD-type hydrolase [Pseudomonadota bacterium]
MTATITRLSEVADRYDAVVFDQWGVLHNGTTPYAGAVSAVRDLGDLGVRAAVLSNSGKRAAPNAARIADMGLPEAWFTQVMTSGEALWRDVAAGVVSERVFHAVERAPGDAAGWAEGLDIGFADLDGAEALLVMGLPDGAALSAWRPVLDAALARGMPLYCSNPDRKSPRAGGTVISPGALAFEYKGMGGDVVFYGKPHRPIFSALQTALGTDRLLMVGDSLEHDIAGAVGAGWDSLFVAGGLYADRFAAGLTLDALVAETGHPAPTYMIGELQ